MPADRAVVLDGRLVAPEAAALSIDDPGVRWGDGLFETMRAHEGAVPLLGRHLARLCMSAAALWGRAVPDPERVTADVAAAVAACGARDQRVRVTGTPRPTLLVEAVPLPPGHPGPLRVASVRGGWCPQREVATFKTLSYAGMRLAARHAAAAGADEALLLDAHGGLGEATAANVFAGGPGGVATPPPDGLLPGVARALVMEIAAEAGVPCREAHLTEAEWRAAPELVLTNAVRGVVAVAVVDGVELPVPAPGPLARLLADGWRARTGWAAG